ncbi:hypothetical protein L1987_57241 [Smallanthus sonchifolius]|uniref:Uncharacterized protein n=1 Tax=Smallanthus sonchifolius TaxID=185202 RepID=A0ACB9DC98_9ASTR|nr:hypothetical protein L1987_57241 [Smallanthus sonchifolius]
MLRIGKDLGRSEKIAPFLTRTWWAREWLATKMAGPNHVERVKNGLYLALRLMRTGSSCNRGFVRSRKLEERKDGPGGSFLPLLRRNSMYPISTVKRETTMTNDLISIVDK